MAKIFIDAGHGGSDSGAVANGLKEKNLTLAIAKECEKVLKAAGVQTCALPIYPAAMVLWTASWSRFVLADKPPL